MTICQALCEMPSRQPYSLSVFIFYTHQLVGHKNKFLHAVAHDPTITPCLNKTFVHEQNFLFFSSSFTSSITLKTPVILTLSSFLFLYFVTKF